MLRLSKKCYEDFDAFYNEVIDRDNNYRLIPIFENFSSYKFYRLFIKSDNRTKWQILDLMNERYSRNPNERLKPDIVFLESFLFRIGNKISKIPSTSVTIYIYKELIKSLTTLIKGLKTTD